MARSIETRLFQQWFRFSRPMTLGVRGIVINAQEQVLLLKHTYTPGWHFPGGGIEKGETAEYSLERELVEEAGVQMTDRPELFGFYSNHKNFPNDHIAVYLVRQWQAVTATSQGEIVEYGFFDIDKLPDEVTSGTAARISELTGKSSRATVW